MDTSCKPGNRQPWCDCVEGETFTCGTDVGECRSNIVYCGVDGKVPPCVPVVSKQPEKCDGLDNNCNGVVDDVQPMPCWTGPDSAIRDRPDTGSPCKSGLFFCENGVWSAECRGEVLPQDELCNARDDDCDGVADNNPITDGLPCGSDVDECHHGVYACRVNENGTTETGCVGGQGPQNEACNNLDDDCDNRVDEDLGQFCQTACGDGWQKCEHGQLLKCSAEEPTEEICDGEDNDCDGETDEGIVCPCIAGISIQPCSDNIMDCRDVPPTLVNCGYGTRICLPGNVWSPNCCLTLTKDEECNNRDDDCDGTVDDFTEDCGPPEAGIGLCHDGQRTCHNGVFDSGAECPGAVYPKPETCNGLDEDCNGLVDDGLNPHEKVDMVFSIDNSPSMCYYDESVRQGFTFYAAEFDGTEHRFALVKFPGDAYYDDQGYLTYEETYRVVIDFSEAADFILALDSLDCQGGGIEPGYDTLNDMAKPENPLRLSWRTDAYPYIVHFTDEVAQTWYGIIESDIALNTTYCGLPGCSPGDAIETYVFTDPAFFSYYDSIVNDHDHLIDINPAEANHYHDACGTIFADACRGQANP